MRSKGAALDIVNAALDGAGIAGVSTVAGAPLPVSFVVGAIVAATVAYFSADYSVTVTKPAEQEPNETQAESG